ncbi:MAG: hypothetical protein MJB57_15595 [Gemmatimonadetes bacterium]|nr:hypothetical protein [Gemmatimonadota bacterium]
MTRAELAAHIETIEKAYEFFLAYAAQGAEDDAAVKVGAQLRQFLGDADAALRALETDLASIIETEGLEPPDAYRAVTETTSRDAAAAGAAVRLVLAQEAISSGLIDNLNASTHLRAVLTDLFLLDDVI